MNLPNAAIRVFVRKEQVCCLICEGVGTEGFMGSPGPDDHLTPCWACDGTGLDPLPWADLFYIG